MWSTLAAEYLTKAGLVVDHETLRGWLLGEGLWEVSRGGRHKHRLWGERRQMAQMDGSQGDP